MPAGHRSPGEERPLVSGTDGLMHHTDLDIDKLHGQVQQATGHFFAEPTPERLFFWERLAQKLWKLEITRREELIAAGFGDKLGPPVWRGPLDRVPVGR